MEIGTTKILGGVGAILMFIGIIPYVNYLGILCIIGLILVMVALYNLASYYAEGGIFNNALYGLIAGIVGVAVAAGAIVLTVLTSLTDFLYELFPTWDGNWSSLSGLTPDPSNLSLDALWPFLTGIFIALVVLWVFAIISAYFARRSLTTLSARSGVGLFGTAGMLLLIGAVLIIAFGLGLILMWISVLIFAIAFFTMRPRETQPATSPQV